MAATSGRVAVAAGLSCACAARLAARSSPPRARSSAAALPQKSLRLGAAAVVASVFGVRGIRRSVLHVMRDARRSELHLQRAAFGGALAGEFEQADHAEAVFGRDSE